ncbi:hypothetical protein HK098_005647 [Nowakowskiella sp. JEL0407]|nr:hypothetical protein HK098_005647 [Nowakowskiella sp. JEL0407]
MFPDPSICKVGKDYYLIHSSFEYFPGIPIHHSTNLVDWKLIGHVLTRESQLPSENSPMTSFGGIYAPTIRYHKGRFYVISTNETKINNKRLGMFVVSTADIYGEWSDPIWIDIDGIDPSLFFEGGNCYLTVCKIPKDVPSDFDFVRDGGKKGTEWGIQQCLVDLETGVVRSIPKYIYTGTGGRWPEGPHTFKIGEYYYLQISEGGTEYAHMVTFARSKNIDGPYTMCPHNPVLTNRSLQASIQSIGHSDLVQTDDGLWFMICHGVRPTGYPWAHVLGREVCLTAVYWDAEGWPHIGEPSSLGRIYPKMHGRLPAPLSPPKPPTLQPEIFGTGGKLKPMWNTFGKLDDGRVEVDGTRVKLVGSGVGLDGGVGCGFVGRRQQHLSASVVVKVNVVDGGKAGISVFSNSKHHYEIFVCGDGNVTVLRRVGSMRCETSRVLVNVGEVVGLWVSHEDEWYCFGYVGENGERVEVERGESRYLSTEVAGGFTGVYFGVFVTDGVAEFSDFVYTF